MSKTRTLEVKWWRRERAGRLWVLSDMFVHFELWVDEREGIVPRCLIPAHRKKEKVNPCCNMIIP
jgi:hypothetical protein